MTGTEPGALGLMLQFLAWVEARPRSYADTMDAWRTSCPRLSVWEDAVAEGLVAQQPDPGSGHASAQAANRVVLTPLGTQRLHR